LRKWGVGSDTEELLPTTRSRGYKIMLSADFNIEATFDIDGIESYREDWGREFKNDIRRCIANIGVNCEVVGAPWSSIVVPDNRWDSQ